MNWLDLIIIICVIIGVFHGLSTGIVKQVISIVSLVAAVLLSGAVANVLHNWLHPYVEDAENMLSTGVQNTVYYILAFIVIIAIFAVLANLVDRIINFTPAGILNKLCGALFGIFMWALCISIVLNFIAVFDNDSQIISQTVKDNSIFYNKVIMIFPNIFPYIRNFFIH